MLLSSVAAEQYVDVILSRESFNLKLSVLYCGKINLNRTTLPACYMGKTLLPRLECLCFIGTLEVVLTFLSYVQYFLTGFFDLWNTKETNSENFSEGS